MIEKSVKTPSFGSLLTIVPVAVPPPCSTVMVEPTTVPSNLVHSGHSKETTQFVWVMMHILEPNWNASSPVQETEQLCEPMTSVVLVCEQCQK